MTYSYHSRDLSIMCSPTQDEKLLRQLTDEVFGAWAGAAASGATDVVAPIALAATLTAHLEGKSGASVYELSLTRRDDNRRVARFIVRVHDGEGSVDAADREREVARSLGISASEVFSKTVVEGTFSVPNAVVYRHAGDEMDADTCLLSTAVARVVASGDVAEAAHLATALGKMLRGLSSAYDVVAPEVTVIPSGRYFEHVRDRFAPDVVVDARHLEVDRRGDALVVPDADGKAPVKLERVEALTGRDAYQRLAYADPSAHCVRLPVQLRWPLASMRGDHVVLTSPANLSLWLRLDGPAREALAGVGLTDQIDLVIPWDDAVTRPATKVLRDMGFSEQACLARADFRKLCSAFKEVRVAAVHTDLHCANVLASPDRLKVIDIGSMGRDLVGTCCARLETSIWDHVTQQVDIEEDDAIGVLGWLQDGKDPDLSELSAHALALCVVLRELRSALHELADAKQAGPEIALAYVTQVLVHQRYHLEAPERQVSPAFAAFGRWWTDALRSEAEQGSVRRKLVVPAATGVEDGAGIPTLHTLWSCALSPQPGPSSQQASELLDVLHNDDRVRSSPLTELQSCILGACTDANPFHSRLNIIIAGPTSSGKSTVAEAFLAAASLFGDRRTCSLYIAPTRALAQAKYRELRQLFAAFPPVHAGVVLSTGEDTDDDWRIVHGQFSIACMVYEKANILFSRSRKLLGKLACVVVDEMHMLSDLERGPILEMALTKIVDERRRIDTQETRDAIKEVVRIIAISTEDAPQDALVRFLEVRDSERGTDPVPPMVFRARSRPVPVEHLLVLKGDPYETVLVTRFAGSDDRVLSREQVREVDDRITTVQSRVLEASVPVKRELVTRELGDRIYRLVVAKLEENPYGYRALVFVPGRGIAEALGRRLRNALLGHGGLWRGSLAHADALRALKPVAEEVEDQKTARTVMQCAEAGVLIHHADVDRKLRHAIEGVCARMPAEVPSQVLIATETLSYGVNLAISDVVLYGIDFNSQTRRREPNRQPLSCSAFHNMTGRAGRLGKVLADNYVSRVYTVVPVDRRPIGIVKRYYTEIRPPSSQLFVKDDRAVLSGADENLFLADAANSVGAADFSYPFVRSVLDVLRHLNAPGDAELASVAKRRVTTNQLLELFSRSLWASQTALMQDPKAEIAYFRRAVQSVLDDSTREPLGLVEDERPGGEGAADEGLYAITVRGEAIIDTGTEIHTIEPLLRILASVTEVWERLYPDAGMPVELYILCLLAQHEVFRQYINYTPECKKGADQGRPWDSGLVDANRNAVFTSFVQALMVLRMSEPDTLAADLRDVLYQWAPIHQVTSAYANGAADSILRFFNAITAWINGEDRALVDELVETCVGGQDRLNGRMLGFRQFVELLSWRTIFLARMLATATHRQTPLTSDTERRLYRLAQRLRLGCTSEAVPLFWPHSSDFKRQQAVTLMNAGMTPGRFLRISAPIHAAATKLGVRRDKLDKLRKDLEGYARKEFRELESVMAVESRESADARRESINTFWHQLADLFDRSIASYRRGQALGADLSGLLRRSMERITGGGDAELAAVLGSPRSPANQRYRVRIELPTDRPGALWYGEASSAKGRAYEKRHELYVVGVQTRRDWFCCSGADGWRSFADVLGSEACTGSLVLVPLPWIPAHEEMPESVASALRARSASGRTTAFVTPAAFAIIVSVLARDFASGESFMSLLARPSGELPFTVVDVKTTQEKLDQVSDGLPPTIRERLLQHFEVAS